MITSTMLPSLLLARAALALPQAELLTPRQAGKECKIADNYPPETFAALPNPFKFATAAGAAITTKVDFDCRAQEISAIMQQYELGDYPPPPDTVKGTLAGNTLTVAVTVAGKSATFTAAIKKPTGAGPVPAIIAIGGSSIPIPNTVATITFANDDFAEQKGSSSHGQGVFFDLFGKDHNAGALAAWAWGVDRLIDVRNCSPKDPTTLCPRLVAFPGC